MAVEYQLDIDTQLDAKTMLDTFLRVTRLEDEVKGRDDSGGFFSIGTQSCWLSSRKENSGKFPSEILGFKPKLRMIFRLAYTAEASPAMTRAVVDWLKQTDEDAALLFNGEAVQFLRKDGQLFLTSNDDAWTDETLRLFDIPHTRQKFEIL
jgi:hypothetical protein